MAKLTGSSSSKVRLTFLGAKLSDGAISLFTIENKTVDALNNLPTDPLFSRKPQWTTLHNGQGMFIGQVAGQEQFEEFSVPFTFSEDFMFVQDGKVVGDERSSVDNFISILQGGIFVSNGEKYRVLGNAGNINLESRMNTKATTNKHWKYLYYNENAFVRDGISFDENGKAKTIANPLLGSFSMSSIGMSLEVYIGIGTGEVRAIRYPLVAFNQIKTNLDGEVIKISTNMEIKADPIEVRDFLVAGGKQESDVFYNIDKVEYVTGMVTSPTYTVPAGAGANKKELYIDDVTGEFRLVDNKVDVMNTKPIDVGTIFYLQKADTGATAGATMGLCNAGTGVVKFSPQLFVVGDYDCKTKKGKLVRWNLDGEKVSTSTTAKNIFPLRVMDYDEFTEDFKLYNSENL